MDNRLIIGVAGKDARGVATLVLGMPTAAWDYCKDGKTHTVDGTKFGMKLQVVLFGCRDYVSGAQILDPNALRQGVDKLMKSRQDLGIDFVFPIVMEKGIEYLLGIDQNTPIGELSEEQLKKLYITMRTADDIATKTYQSG